METTTKVLLIEDSKIDRMAFQRLVREKNLAYDWAIASSIDSAKQILDRVKFDVVLCDHQMGDGTSFDILNLKLSDPIIVITGTGNESVAVATMKAGAYDYLIKDSEGHYLEVLPLVIATAVKHRQAEAAIQQLNENLKQRTAELEIANKELEAFSYSVSHDLRNPLTTILASTWLLLNKFSHQLEPKALSCLNRINESSQQMEQLIQDLLKLSQITQAEIEFQTVNLSAIVQDIADRLQQTQPSRELEWVIAENLDVQGDPNLLKIALENLLGNAWKYTRKQPTPRIEFGAIAEGQKIPNPQSETYNSTISENVYFIRDNGAGFDMADASRLFVAFQRLHSQSEFEGTGVGLATVQRIIQRHGGKIWAKSAPEEGAAFYFTLG